MRKRMLITIIILLLSCLDTAYAMYITNKENSQPEDKEIESVAECLNKQFKKYEPTESIKKTLHELFPDPNFFTLLEQQDNPREFLINKGFIPLQFSSDKKAAVVLASDKLPEYVIKFMRIGAPKAREKKKWGGAIPVPSISNRVINTEEIKKIIDQLKLSHVGVPNKYFYCIDNIAIVVSQRVTPSKRTFKDLNSDEIIELLKLVYSAKGILDLKERNTILTDKKIIFIDTEREKATDRNKWDDLFKTMAEKFKSSIDPKYKNLVMEWVTKLEKK